MKMNIQENGQNLILEYKYGKKDVFSSYEQSKELIKKYPILIKILPHKYMDKEMIMTFVKANKEWIDQYNSLEESSEKRLTELAEKNIIALERKDIYNHIKMNALIRERVDFGECMKDEDVLLALDDMEGERWNILYSDYYELTPNNYDEKIWEKVVKKSPRMATRLYSFWCDNIGNDKKLIEHIKVKYKLFNNPKNSELALYKCFDIVKQEEAIAYIYLAFSVNEGLGIVDADHENISKEIFKKFDDNTKKFLIHNFYYNLRFMSKEDIDAELAVTVKENCDIAGDLLSDEYVLKYDLEKSINEEEMQKKCRDCQKCLFAKCKLV